MLLYLASTSPRRRELLQRAGLDYVCVAPGAEPAGAGAPAALAAQRAASKCAGAAVPADAAPGLVLAVDTVVEVDGAELGKPRDRDDAERMLRRLAGRTHLVHTAHSVRRHPGPAAESARALATAQVAVRPLAEAEIAAYLDGGEWVDKAGGYGIQGAAGRFCTVVQGDLDTVVGLSLRAVRTLLAGAEGGRF